ncbi:MAG TPA: Fic family protein, partial [Thermoanaerobaculia bacterium]|nr:Fic family protein [Thermoanaerobaculia bacterium]
SIEGYNVSFEDAIAAIEGEEPEVDPKDENWLAVAGYRQALTFVLQKSEDPYFKHSEELLKSLHYMMVGWDLSKNPGRWRPGAIFVKNEASGEIVYEGPPAGEVQGLMAELAAELNSSTPSVPNIVQAAMAHLNLVMIHPFSDGNGRMARGLQTLVLATQGMAAPQFSSIEEYLGRNTMEYYAVLAEVGAGSWNPERDARPWVRFCLRAHYHQALTLLRRSREMNRLWNAVEELINHLDLPERMIPAVADAAYGRKVRNTTYRSATDVSEVVASRDLRALVEANLLEKKGENRGRYYVAAPVLLEIRKETAEPRAKLPDPFAPQPQEPSRVTSSTGPDPGGTGNV